MKNFTTRLLALFMVLSPLSSTLFSQTWSQAANFGGAARYATVGFTIGSKCYIGTGNTGSSFLKDFWEYDPATNTWTKKADLPTTDGGGARHHAMAFSIGGKGYIGGGSNPAGGSRSDLWEYDPTTNTWTKKADLPAGRTYGVGFSVGSKGYIGGGENAGAKTDFWEYDPTANTWTTKTNMPLSISAGFAFGIGSKGYVGDGWYSSSLYEYDPSANTWTNKGAVPVNSSVTAGTSNGTYGYMIGGDPGYTDCYEYNPTSNTWTQKTNIPQQLGWSIALSIGTDIYLGTGASPTNVYTTNFYATSAVLSAELLHFTGKNTEGGNLLTWQTQNEVNNKGFEVERQNTIGNNWETLGFVAPKSSKGTANGYSFMDNTPHSMSYYRLKQIDNDGQFTYSKTIAVQSFNKKGLKLYPSVSTGILNIETTETGADFQIINLLGQQVMGGKTKQPLDVSALPKGTYLLKIGIEQVKFIKQ